MTQTKSIAILQSNYIPWKGYFDMIASVDEFILFDDMQYTRRDWRNRNKIKTANGLIWLTVPVLVKGKYTQTIRETEIATGDWVESHRKSIHNNYRKSPHFDEIMQMIDPIYECGHTHLSELNRALLEACCDYLNITTKIKNSWDYGVVEGKTERLLDLCKKARATNYVSGPAAKGYLDEDLFKAADIDVTWFDYSSYPEYPQLWGEFEHGVTVLDLLFNVGKSAPSFLKFA